MAAAMRLDDYAAKYGGFFLLNGKNYFVPKGPQTRLLTHICYEFPACTNIAISNSTEVQPINVPQLIPFAPQGLTEAIVEKKRPQA